MSIHLYNNLHRRLEPFAPASPDNLTVYLCGPTVYNYVHIGNARGPVVFDVLIKLLRRHFPKVTYARNITDVDDKINAAAKALDVPIAEITDKYTAIYRATWRPWACRRPTSSRMPPRISRRSSR